MLSDSQWEILHDALKQVCRGPGRPLADQRQTIEAIIWRMSNGAKWRAVPSEFGPWHRAAQLHIRWSQKGVWERVFALLRKTGHAELRRVFLDGSNIRAHQKAAGAKKGGRWVVLKADTEAKPVRRAIPLGNL